MLQTRCLLLAAICSCLWCLAAAEDGGGSCEDVCRMKCSLQGNNRMSSINHRSFFNVMPPPTSSSPEVGGDNQVFSGDHLSVRGNANYIRGKWVQVTGNGNKIFGDNAHVIGHQTKIVGDNATVMGNFAIIRGRTRALVVGNRSTIESDNAQVLGMEARITGDHARVIGNDAVVIGNHANISGSNIKVIGSEAFVCCDIGNKVTVTGSFLKIGVILKALIKDRFLDTEEELNKYDNHVIINGFHSVVTSSGCRLVKEANKNYNYELTMSGDDLKVHVDGELMQGTTLDKPGIKIQIVT